MIEELKKAGKINYRVLRLAKKIIEPGVSYLEVVKKIEEYILDHNAIPAFPVNISVNEIAAHFTPIDNSLKFKEGDVVKIDAGVCIDGWISDSAITIEIKDNKYKDLIRASKEALENVIKILKKGIEIWEIGKEIEETAKKYGFNPIYNLTGHQIDRWKLHSGIQIPNYNNHSKIKLEEGIYAIEPFITNGIGYVKDFSNSNILIIKNLNPLIRDRIARDVFNFIIKNYRTLPFSRRWLIEKFGKIKANYAINYLKRNNILYEYPILKEKTNGIVTQFEHTFYIGKEILVISGE